MTDRGHAICVAVLIATVNCGNNSAIGPADPAALNVLFIGNSLTATNDLPGMVLAMIESVDAGPAEFVDLSVPGFGLEDHWVANNVRETIAKGGWDLVVLQQGPSATEGRPSLLEYSQRFADEARLVDSFVGLYMVWPSVARAFDFDGVSDSYRTAAEQVGGLLFPAGEAWRMAWASDPSLPLYSADEFHPSEMGTYVAALVMFEQLTGLSPIGLPHALRTRSGVGVSIDANVAAVLQAAAAEANRVFALAVPGWAPNLR